MTKASDAARWMDRELRRKKILDQEVAVHHIKEQYGDTVVYTNANGNLAIHPDVLKAFRHLNEKDVVWDREERVWRYRREYDPSTGRQV